MDYIDITNENVNGSCTGGPAQDTTGVTNGGPASDTPVSRSSFGSGFAMDQSHFGQVVFHEVDDIYPTDCDLRCSYSLTESVQATQGDRIALYKVGWKYITDYLIFKLAPIPLEEKGFPILRIAFSASMLPKEESDLYQLCYLTVDNSITGASVPFGFRRPNANELVAVEDRANPGMMIYKSRTAILYDRIAESENEKEMLELKLTALSSQLAVHEKELALAASNHKLLTSALDSARLDFERERVTHLELKNRYTQLNEVYDECKKKIDRCEKEIAEKDIMLGKLKDGLAEAMSEVKRNETELSGLRAQAVEKELMLKELTHYSEQLNGQLMKVMYEQASASAIAESERLKQQQPGPMEAELAQEVERLRNRNKELENEVAATMQLLESALQAQEPKPHTDIALQLQGKVDALTLVNNQLAADFTTHAETMKRDLHVGQITIEAIKQDLNAARKEVADKEKELERVTKEFESYRLECSNRMDEVMTAFENTDKQHEMQKNEIRGKLEEAQMALNVQKIEYVVKLSDLEKAVKRYEVEQQDLQAKIVELEMNRGERANAADQVESPTRTNGRESEREELVELVHSLRKMLLEAPAIDEQWRLLLESATVSAKESYRDLMNNFDFISTDRLTGTNLKVQQLVDSFCVVNQCLESSKEECQRVTASLETCRNQVESVLIEKSELERKVVELSEMMNEIGNCLQAVKREGGEESEDVKGLKMQLAQMEHKRVEMESELKALKTEKAMTNIGRVTVDQQAMADEIELLRQRLKYAESSVQQNTAQANGVQDSRKQCEKLEEHLKKSATEYAKLYHKFVKERGQRLHLESLLSLPKDGDSLSVEQQE